MDNFRETSDFEFDEAGSSNYIRPSWAVASAPTPRRPVARKRLLIVSPKGTPSAPKSQEIAAEFRLMCKVWKNETQFLSDSHEIAMHRAYQRIIGMGYAAVPLVIEELQMRGGDWFWALSAMTGVDPIPKEDWGNFRQMKAAWLNWWSVNQEALS